MSLPLTLDHVLAARAAIRGTVVATPLLAAPRLSALTGAQVFVKYENLQTTNSFKDRGASYKLSRLDATSRARGVIAVSAGNHAQAVAHFAHKLGIPAVIVMPETTPHVKVAATRASGARVLLAGDTLADAAAVMETVREAEGLTLVHPYDDRDIAAGQGTIALEMLEAEPDLDTLVIPVGGGGLASGMAVAAKALKPGLRIVAVESALYPSLRHALTGDAPVLGGQTLAEGIAVKQVGALALAVLGRLMDEHVAVSETALERAVNLFLTLQKTMAEGAGAAGLAALLTAPELFRGRRVGLVLCGGNIDPRIAASVMVRELERAEQIVAFRLRIADRPGVLGRIATTLGVQGCNILSVGHRRLFLDVPAKGVSIDVTVETRGEGHVAEVAAALVAAGFSVERIPAAEA